MSNNLSHGNTVVQNSPLFKYLELFNLFCFAASFCPAHIFDVFSFYLRGGV